jgi:DNA-binding NarL/FixJ family response regulator
MNIGILGYVLKDSAISDIIDCIKSVSEGKYYITPSLSDYLINRRNKLKRMEENKPALKKLTKTEMNVLILLAEGKTSKQIGEEMYISHKTVDNHKTNISDKLQLKGLHGLMKFAIENKAILQ